MLIVVWVIFKIWLILVMNVKFLGGIFIVLSVVNNIMNDMFGIFVIFFDVIINISNNVICCVIDKLILYICVKKIVVIVWYKVDLFKLNE